jgi:hypothetical protein
MEEKESSINSGSVVGEFILLEGKTEDSKQTWGRRSSFCLALEDS